METLKLKIKKTIINNHKIKIVIKIKIKNPISKNNSKQKIDNKPMNKIRLIKVIKK